MAFPWVSAPAGPLRAHIPPKKSNSPRGGQIIAYFKKFINYHFNDGSMLLPCDIVALMQFCLTKTF